MNKISFYLFTALLVCSGVSQALENQLADHASPYLAMHGQDPVVWQDWSADVIEQAKKENKIIFISSGYFACHWCHVMQRESYQDENIAKLLNSSFIPVKVDRELLPALDKHLIDFVQRTQGSAGWPLNVFLTPEGYPLVGLTYSPPTGFQELLSRLTALWKKDADNARDVSRRALLKMAIEKDQLINTSRQYTAEQLRDRFFDSVFRGADEMSGGFGLQSRFPMAPQLKVLLNLQAKHPDDRLKNFLRLTLDQMADNGMRDHLAGGFFRYTVDPQWQEPHYEKMLYTQALLVEVYLMAADILQRPDYQKVATDTLNFVLAAMQGKQGAYIASFSAVDDKGVEGGYYLWLDEVLQQTLGPDVLKLARRYWLMEGLHDVDEGYLPKRGVSTALLAKETEQPEGQVLAMLAFAQKQLLAARAQRVLPVDDKELAGWNGLMLAAMAKAAQRLKSDHYRQAALTLKSHLFSRLWDGTQVFRAKKGTKIVGKASLSDYVYLASGLDAVIKLDANEQDKALLAQLISTAWQRFHLKKGWQQSDTMLLPGMAVDKATEDGALPSAVAMLIKLSLESPDPKIKALAEKALEQSAVVIEDAPFWYASQAELLFTQ